MPVLGRICGTTATWPALSAADANNEIYAYTNAQGQVTFFVIPGTIPGKLTIEARPTDQSSETLQSVDLSRVDPIATLTIAPMGAAANMIGGIRADLQRYGYLDGVDVNLAGTDGPSRRRGRAGAVNVAPIRRNGSTSAVLVYPAGERIAISPSDGSLLGDPPGRSSWSRTPGTAPARRPISTSPAPRVQGYIADFPTYDQWLAGGTLSAGASGSWGTRFGREHRVRRRLCRVLVRIRLRGERRMLIRGAERTRSSKERAMKEILPGLFHWTARHPKIHIEVSSYWVESGGVLIDPLVPPDAGLEWFASRPTTPTTVILSNRHHYRQSDQFVARFGCSVRCTRAGMHEFTHGEIVEPFDPGDALAGGIIAFGIGGICPDDTALYLPAHDAVSFADGLVRGGPRSDDPGALGFVPDSLMDDPPGTKRALLASFTRALDELEFKHVLLAHGMPLVGNGRAALEELVRSGGRTAFEM